MKKDVLTVKELAAELRMSPKSIQRAYRKEEIPLQWLGPLRDSILQKSNGRWNGMDDTACVVSTTTCHRRARPPDRAGGAHRRNAPVW